MGKSRLHERPLPPSPAVQSRGALYTSGHHVCSPSPALSSKGKLQQDKMWRWFRRGIPRFRVGRVGNLKPVDSVEKNFPQRFWGDKGGNGMSRIKYPCPPHSSGLTSRCDRPPDPAAGTGSLPENPGPRAASGTAAAGAELQQEGEAEGALRASGPQHSLPGSPYQDKMDFNFHFIPKALCK